MSPKTLKLTTALCCFGAVFATSVNAQKLTLGDESIKIEDALDKQQTLIEPAWLRLGHPFGNGVDGAIELFDADSNLIFGADAPNRLVWMQLELRVADPVSSTSIVLDGVGAGITAGNSGADGDLTLKNTSSVDTLHLDGATGTAQNTLLGNGFIKGWARMAANGTLLSCYNCNADPTKTGRTALGTYYVDFGPIASDISSRPRIAVLDRHGTTQPGVDRILLDDDDTGDPSRIKVFTGPAQDHAFTITVF